MVAAAATSTATSNIKRLHKDWTQAKAQRDSANKARNEAVASLKASHLSTNKDTTDALESKVKVARRLHVRAVKEERRLFKELNAAHDSAAAAAAASTDLNENASQNTRQIHEASNNNSTTAEIPTQRKRQRISNQYIIYKERDDVFREWLNSISTIDLDPVDNLLLAVQDLHDRILHQSSNVDLPEFVIKNLDRSIELRQDEAERIEDDADEGHEYYISVLQSCSQCLKRCRAILRERQDDSSGEEEVDRRAAKRRRLVK
ncbi:hypothetical protein ACHAWO_009835 [Cyclotella atomus]|uniref:DUF6604 domain-containing protein n=1 Tax=Cyclotella atomus TaxID=382360 RepID=A0ABD3QM96_9STRA